MRFKCLVFFVVMVSAAAYAGEWKKDFAVNGTPDVNVDTNDGAVVITTGPDNNVFARVIKAGWRTGIEHVHWIIVTASNWRCARLTWTCAPAMDASPWTSGCPSPDISNLPPFTAH